MYSKILDHPEAIQPLCLVTGFFQAVLCHYSEFIYSFVGKLNIMIPTFYHQIPTFSYFSPTFFLNSLLLFSYFFIKTDLKACFGSKFWFKFHWWCISHEPMIRNHSYFNHRYPIGFALFLSVRTVGPCPGVGLEVKI